MSAEALNEQIALGGLLRIDVQAQIRKLSDAQLQGSWQLGAECVRLALSSQANRVTVRTRWSGFELVAQGATLEPKFLTALAIVLDDSTDPAQRQASLENLEASEHPVLLVLLSASIRKLRWTLQGPKGRVVLVKKRGQRPVLAKDTHGTGTPHIRIELSIHRLDRQALRRSLRDLCRFSPVQVIVDGKATARGMDDIIAQGRAPEPLSGELGIAGPKSASRVWLLQHGIVRTHLSLPQRPWFVACLEMSSKVRADAAPSDLRSAFETQLTPLVDRSITILSHAVASSNGEATMRCLRHRLLDMASVPHLLARVESIPVFRYHPAKSPASYVSLATLAEALEWQSDAQTRGLATLDPQDIEQRAHRNHALVEIEDHLQARLCEILDHPLPPAQRRAAPPSWSFRRRVAALRFWRRTRGGLWVAIGRAKTRVRWRLFGALPEQQLAPPIRRALAEIQNIAGRGTRVMVTAKGGPLAWAGDALILPLDCSELVNWSALSDQHIKSKGLIWTAIARTRRGRAKAANTLQSSGEHRKM